MRCVILFDNYNIAIVFIVTMLALAWAIFEDTELGQAIVEHFKERWEDDA